VRFKEDLFMPNYDNYDNGYGTSAAKILVVGVGGAGNNAVNRMISENIQGVRYACVNTDKQQLDSSLAEDCIQIGARLTRGLGAGAKPEVGKKAAEESLDDIDNLVDDSDMVFVTCGMGGGTGTGAAPIVAEAARKKNKLTVGIVTKPFRYEGRVRMNNAESGIAEIRDKVDTLIIIPNDKLLEIVDKNTSLSDALKMADEVLKQSIQGITDLINKQGLINLDFADVQTVMANKGIAHIGIGYGTGENKCVDAVTNAINSPLLETSITGATDIIINYSGNISMYEADAATAMVQEQAGPDANIIFGVIADDTNPDTVMATVIATGISDGKKPASAAGFANTQRPWMNGNNSPASGTTVQRPTSTPFTFRERPQSQSSPFSAYRGSASQPATTPQPRPVAPQPRPVTTPQPQKPVPPQVHQDNGQSDLGIMIPEIIRKKNKK